MNQYCERCGEKLNPKTSVMLEMDGSSNLYYKPGKLPPERSQGGFYFGKACAKAVLANGGAVQTIGYRAPANRPKRRAK